MVGAIVAMRRKRDIDFSPDLCERCALVLPQRVERNTAVRQVTIAAARDLSSVGIRVNTIAPGTMKTPIMESVGEEAIAKFAANVPFPKRLGTPDEYADAATFLLTNGYVNGEVMRLDGAQRFTPK